MDFEPVLAFANRRDMATIFPQNGIGAEIGVLHGNFSLDLHVAANPRKLYLVDRWGGDWKPSDQSWQEIFQCAKDRMHDRPGVEFVQSDSISWLAEQPDNSLDWVYLDADHSRASVSAEIAAARRVVRPGGIIAGHDYTLDPRDKHGNPYPCGVVEAVQDAVAFGLGRIVAFSRDHVPSFAMRTAPKPGTKIVVGCSPRTGSNLLIDSLASHPQALNAGEIFNIPLFWTPRVLGLKQRGFSPVQHCNLFKLFPYDDGHYGFEQLLGEGKVIYLYREDRSAQMASWRKACETGLWFDTQTVPHKVEFLDNAEEVIDRAESLFAARAAMTLSYEELVQDWDSSIAAILEMAGWEPMRLDMARNKQSQ